MRHPEAPALDCKRVLAARSQGRAVGAELEHPARGDALGGALLGKPGGTAKTRGVGGQPAQDPAIGQCDQLHDVGAGTTSSPSRRRRAAGVTSQSSNPRVSPVHPSRAVQTSIS